MTVQLPGQDRILSRDVMERLVEEAALSPRAQVRLGSLRRLAKACDDIASGRAREMAAKAGLDEAVFGLAKRPNINPASVAHYVRIRATIDGKAGQGETSEWKGPHAVTIRKEPEGMALYVNARRAEAFGLAKPRPPRSRARRVDEIVAGVADMDDRLLLMHAFEDGYAAAKRYGILVAALRTIPGIDVDGLIKADGSGPARKEPELLGPLGREERRILKGMFMRLTDAGHLREFGLLFDGSRLRMSMAPATELITKKEFDILRSLSDHDA